MNSLDTLLYFFPTGTTEGERHILKEAFVEVEEYTDIISPPPFSPRLLVGKKGSGKSAIIEYSMETFKELEIPAIKIKPSEIDLSGIPTNASIAEIIKITLPQLAKTVAIAIGKSLSGCIISSNDKLLHDQAKENGSKEPDFIELLTKIITNIAKATTKTDVSALITNSKSPSTNHLLKAISNNLNKTDQILYLFIDDTDQVAAPDISGHLNRIWGFILAARELSQKLEQLRIVISLREEVWRRIKKDRAAQRDQTDHFTTLVWNLNPTRDHIHKIIEKRVELASRKVKSDETSTWNIFFEPENPKIPMTNQRSSWPDLIVVRSRERPRDSITLINYLALAAKKHGIKKIDDKLFAEVMVEFSQDLFDKLITECDIECPQLDHVLRTFSGLQWDHGSFKAKNETIKKHLLKLGGSAGIQLNGSSLKPGDEDDMFRIWKYLFEIGFLNARVADTREKDGYRHIYPRQDSNYVSKARWNDMQATAWEIGPAYRDFLISLQGDKNARKGLPPAGRKKKY
jgi:hypothetical protein